jgi:hypothetical protein
MPASNATTMVAAVVTAMDKVSVIGKRGGSGSQTAAAGTTLGATLAEHALAIQNHKTLIDAGITTVATGTKNIPLDTWKLPATLLPLAASASAGVFGLVAGTYGSATATLIGEATANGTKTDYVRTLVSLPRDYVAGNNVTLVVHARASTTVTGAKQLDAEAFLSDKEAGAGSDLCATAIQTISATAYTNYSFTITGTTLNPGDVLDIRLTGVLTDTGSGATVLIGDTRITY